MSKKEDEQLENEMARKETLRQERYPDASPKDQYLAAQRELKRATEAFRVAKRDLEDAEQQAQLMERYAEQVPNEEIAAIHKAALGSFGKEFAAPPTENPDSPKARLGRKE